MPTPEQALSLWTERHVREIREEAAGTVYDGFLQLAGQIRQHLEADDLVAFLLKYFFAHHRMDRIQAAHLSETVATSGARTKSRGREKPSDERGKRKKPAAEHGAQSKSAIPAGSVRLWLNLGASDGLNPAGLKEALEGLAAPVASISRVDLRPTYSYLIVSEESAPAFEALVGKSVGNKSLKLERAKRR
jgi:ATP-dependent RNA helicase DeaD